MKSRARTPKSTFRIILIKPSHYDKEGYVIQWQKSTVPSNTLAALYGLIMDCAQRQILGDTVQFKLHAYDESNTRININKISRLIQSSEAGLVALVGVQTNQFPRSMDIARQFRAQNIQVCIGGFHVSASASLLPDGSPELRAAMDLGISLFAGEAEGRMEILLKDAYRHQMKPLYNYMNELPDLEGKPVPYLPASVLRRTLGARTSFDAGRGCPFRCSFCTVIKVQGQKSRSRGADDVEQLVRTNLTQGISNYFITDDNFSRNKRWEEILDRLIQMRSVEKIRIRLIIQVDALAHTIPRFVEKAGRAGVDRVFIGLESINPEALQEAGKGQNKVGEYRATLNAWHQVGAVTYAGYILGFPNDTSASILRDIKLIQRDLPVDLLEFFILTPLPGSADHQKLLDQGAKLDSDLNRYDVFHVTTEHPKMSRRVWEGIYEKAWDAYYSPEHVEKVIRRSKEWGLSMETMMLKLLHFHFVPAVENVHPLEGGIFRKKYRIDRRPGMPIESRAVFYPRFLSETLQKAVSYHSMKRRYQRILRRLEQEEASSLGTLPHADHPSLRDTQAAILGK